MTDTSQVDEVEVDPAAAFATTPDNPQALDDYLSIPAGEGVEPPSPRDERIVNGLLRRLRGLRQAKESAKTAARMEAQATKEWRDDRIGQIEREEGRIAGVLEPYMRHWHNETRQRTLPFPAGKLTLRRPGAHVIEVTDEDAFYDWAQQMAGFSPEEWADLVKRLGSYGMKIVPGVDKIALAGFPTGDPVPDDKPGRTAAQVATFDGEPVPGVKATRPDHDRFGWEVK